MVTGLTCAGAFAPHALQAAISYSAPESLYTQNFDTLPFSPTNSSTFQASTGGWIDDTVDPVGQVSIPGFYLYHPTASATEGGTNQHQRLRAGSGSSSVGAFYSFGTNGSSERALGMLNSASLTGNGADAYIALRLINNTGVTLNSFSLTYTGEQYRAGENNSQETLKFGYSTSATLTDWNTTGVYTSMPLLNFTAPNVTTSLTGASQQSLASTVISASAGFVWAPGTELWLRWSDTQLAGLDDDGLAIDDLQFSASTAAGPSLEVNSIATGLASAPTTWSNNQAPSAAFNYTVNSGHTVTINSAFAGNEMRVSNGGVASINAGGNGQALNSLIIEAGGNLTETVTGDVTIGNSVALNDGVSPASNLGVLQTDQNLTFNMDAGSKFGVAMRLKGTGNVDFNATGTGSEVTLAGAAEQTGSTVIRFNGTGDKVRLVKDQKINRIEMNSTGANAFIYETTTAVTGGVITFNQNGAVDHNGKNRLIQPSVINITDKTVAVDLSKTFDGDERRFLIENNLQGSGTLTVNGAAADPTDLNNGGSNGTTLNEFELGTQSVAGDVNNSFSGTLIANDYVNLELRKNLPAAKIVVNDNAVFDMGFPSVTEIAGRETMRFGEVEINSGGTLEVGFEASIAGGQIGRHVARLELASGGGRSGSLTLNNGATTVMQLNGVGAYEFDTIQAQGSIVLDGTLKIVVNPSAFTGTNALFTPTIGNAFELMTAAGAGFPAADFNHNGAVDAADLATWKGAFGMGNGADANGDGVTDGNDFLVWQRTLGQTGAGISGAFDSIVVEDPNGWMAGKTFQVVQTATSFSLVVAAAVAAVPEPSTALLTSIAFACLTIRRRR